MKKTAEKVKRVQAQGRYSCNSELKSLSKLSASLLRAAFLPLAISGLQFRGFPFILFYPIR